MSVPAPASSPGPPPPAPGRPSSPGGHLRRTAWLAGAVLGGLGAILVFFFPLAGLGMIAAALGLVLWQGPALAGVAGVVTGVGATWSGLFLRVFLRCDTSSPAPGLVYTVSGEECFAPGLEPYLAGSAVVAGIGLLLTIIAAARRPGRH